MMSSRRRVLQAAVSLFSPLAWSQSKHNLVVRSAMPENLETPLQAFGPWLTPAEHFFVRSHHSVAKVNMASWKLSVAGDVTQALSLTMQDLRQFPRAELVSVLECAGNGRVFLVPKVDGVQWQTDRCGLRVEEPAAPLAQRVEGLRRELEGDRIMRVAEQTERPGQHLQRAHRVELVEDVRVLVERRPVTDLHEIVDVLWSGRQRGEPLAVRGLENLQHPLGGAPRHRIEALRLLDP